MVRYYLKRYNIACFAYSCNVKHYLKRYCNGITVMVQNYRNAGFGHYCNAFNMRENMCENILSRVNSREPAAKPAF